MRKYKNIKTEAHGHMFDSQKEARRFEQLILLRRGGVIRNLRLQVPFVLAESVVLGGRKKPALRYIADFVYVERGQEVVEDVKGMRTAVYRIKKHLMKSVHGIEIREI